MNQTYTYKTVKIIRNCYIASVYAWIYYIARNEISVSMCWLSNVAKSKYICNEINRLIMND